VRAITVLFLVFCSTVMFADTLFLKSKEKLVGEILGETATEIEMKVKDEVMVIPKSMIAEVEEELVFVTMYDGRELKGKLIEEDVNSITLRLRFGEMQIMKDEIDSMEKKIVKGPPKVWSVNEVKKYEKERKKKYSGLTIDKVEFPPKTEDLTRDEIQELHRKVHEHFRKKEYRSAIKVLQKILRSSPTDQIAWYNLACAYSLLGKKKQAMEALLLAVKAGYADFMWMENDKDLDNIRKMKEYKQLLKEADRIMREAAGRTLENLKKQFGEGYTYLLDEERRLIFATNQSMEVLNKLKERLYRLADALWNDFFDHRPKYYITIVCPSRQDYRKMQPNPNVGGWYNPGTKILIAGSIGGVLDHEFTHAMHFGDQHGIGGQHHPIWIAEGFATLMEAAHTGGGHCLPHLVSGRLRMIQMAVRSNRYVPLQQFVRLPQSSYVRNAGVCYAQGRYVMMYLWKKKKLKEWYDLYVKNYNKDQTGAMALEKVLGKPLQQIEADWKQWVMSIRQQNRHEKKPAGPDIGLTVGECEKGIVITKVDEGSKADGRLKEGDMILSVNGKKVTTLSDIDEALGSVRSGRQITFSIIRRIKKKRRGKVEYKEQKMKVRVAA